MIPNETRKRLSRWLGKQVKVNEMLCATLPSWMKKDNNPEYYRYDIYLGGPREERALIPNYKQTIKNSFPNKRFFDPFGEKQKIGQRDGSWFINNALAFLYAKTFICMVPEFPMPGVGPEAGMFFLNNSNLLNPLSSLIFIWPKEVKPDYGKEVCNKMGIVVETIEAAIKQLKNYFNSLK